MTLSRREVENIAHLARLAIKEEEIASYVESLSSILDFVRQLESRETGSVEPMAHPLAMSQRLRPDEVTEPDERERARPNAPAIEAGLYVVPRVIE